MNSPSVSPVIWQIFSDSFMSEIAGCQFSARMAMKPRLFSTACSTRRWPMREAPQ